MIEAYAFLAAFTVQILAMSAVYPAWFIRYCRVLATGIPAERLAQMYPDVDLSLAQEQFFTRIRALNAGIAVLGLLLLGWLFSYLRRPDWDDGPVEALVTAYYLLQVFLPLGLVAWVAVRFHKMHGRPLLERKRKALLERRTLFDFVSPSIVLVAVVSYFLFGGFVIYIQQDPFQGFAGPLINIGCITLVYALNAFVVYTMLYGKKANPFETHAGRVHTIGLAVKSSVYSCIVIVAYLSLNFTLGLLDWQRWEPFALSVFFVSVALLSSRGLTAPPRPPGENAESLVVPERGEEPTTSQ
jgi:hypothetical protein